MAAQRAGTRHDAGPATARLAGPVEDADGFAVDHCDSGIVRWRLERAHVYAGVTSDGGALSVRVDPAGKRLTRFFVDLEFVCASTIYLYSLRHLDIAVRHGDRFAKRGFSGLPFEVPGGRALGLFSLRGRLTARRASGSYRARGTLRQADGTTLTCDTGTARWTAIHS